MLPPFTVNQVANMLKCSERTVRVRALDLGGVKFGTDWVFPAGAFFQRLDALALAEPAKAPAPSPTAVVQQIGAGRNKRTPPPLPQLAGSGQ